MGLKKILSEVLENRSNDSMQVFNANSFENALRSLVGKPLEKIQDEASFMRLYQMNKHGIGGSAPEDERRLEDFISGLSFYLIKRKWWVTAKQLDANFKEMTADSPEKKEHEQLEQELNVKFKQDSEELKAKLSAGEIETRDALKTKLELRKNVFRTLAKSKWGQILKKHEENRENIRKEIYAEKITPADIAPPAPELTYKIDKETDTGREEVEVSLLSDYNKLKEQFEQIISHKRG